MTSAGTRLFTTDRHVEEIDGPRSAAPAAGSAAAAPQQPLSPSSADVDLPRDADAAPSRDWPFRALGVSATARPATFAAVFAQSALDEIHMHGQSAPAIEVCGVLVGQCCRDNNGPFLHVEHVIRGSAAASRSTNVTFTAETWQHIQGVMDSRYADKKIVGWYHTHPGFGIFLSEMDLFICENFFNLPWQCAFVYDPKGGDEGNFLWRKGKPTREPVLIEDDVTPKAAAVPLISVADAMTGPGAIFATAAARAPSATPLPSAAAPEVEALLKRVHGLERRQRLLFATVAFLFAFVVAAQLSPFGPAWLRQLLPAAPVAASSPAATEAKSPTKPAAAGADHAAAPAHSVSAAHPSAAPRSPAPPPVPEVLRQ